MALLTEQVDSLKQSLQTSVAATEMAENRSRELDAEGDVLRDEVTRAEAAVATSKKELDAVKLDMEALQRQLAESQGTLEELEAALTVRGGELVAMTEERNRYQRQLEETEGLLSGQREMMDLVRENLEQQQGRGGFDNDAAMGGGTDLAAEAKAAEMENLMDNLAQLSEDLR